MALQQELLKSAGVAALALLYIFAGVSSSTGSTVIIALSVIQVTSLINVLTTLPPSKKVSMDESDSLVQEAVESCVRFVSSTSVPVHWQSAAFFVLALAGVKMLLFCSIISAWYEVAAFACVVGAVRQRLASGSAAVESANYSTNEECPYTASFWFDEAADKQTQENLGQSPLAHMADNLDATIESIRDAHKAEATMREMSEEQWNFLAHKDINDVRLAGQNGEEEQWAYLMGTTD